MQGGCCMPCVKSDQLAPVPLSVPESHMPPTPVPHAVQYTQVEQELCGWDGAVARGMQMSNKHEKMSTWVSSAFTARTASAGSPRPPCTQQGGQSWMERMERTSKSIP